jgi:hypothetical protein
MAAVKNDLTNVSKNNGKANSNENQSRTFTKTDTFLSRLKMTDTPDMQTLGALHIKTNFSPLPLTKDQTKF